MSQQMKWEFSGNPAENSERYLVPAIFIPLAADLIKLANPHPDERVLDVACGTGIVARRVAEKLGSLGKIFGLDINTAMLTVARSLQPTKGTFIEWREGDVTDMLFMDAMFDLAFCQQALQFFPYKLAALREIHRVLTPGGRLILNVFTSIQDNPAYTALAEVLERHVSAETAASRRAIFALGDADELHALLVEAGYRDITIDTVVPTVRFPSPEEFLRRQLASWKSEVVAGMDDETRVTLVSDFNVALELYVDDEGLAFPMGTHLAIAYKQAKV
jgi:ubiquinone/menaquinone biosynthesis C-methylase UbiE